MSDADRQAVSTSLTAVRSVTHRASSHSSDLPAYTYRLADHLLIKAARPQVQLSNAPASPHKSRTPTIAAVATAPPTPPLPAAGPGRELGPESGARADLGLADEQSARAWHALASGGVGWSGAREMVRMLGCQVSLCGCFRMGADGSLFVVQAAGPETGPVAFSGGLAGFDPSFEFPVDDVEFW